MEKIPFAKICFSEQEEREVLDCLRSGWITTGPRVAAFEKAFAEFVGAEDAVAVSCGTAALHLALWCLDLQPGDEVITPSLTWVSVPNLVTLLGGKPVFCDVDPDTLNLDLDALTQLITPRTRALVPVHYAGRPVDIEAAHEIASSHGLYVVEDACHAIGAEYKNRRIGAHSGLCTFSFHPNKNMTTAEGGMITGTDLEKLKRIRLLRFHGVSRDSFKRTGSGQLPHYEALFPGLKLSMTDLAASLGMHQLKKVRMFNERRTTIVGWYRKYLKNLENRLWIPPPCDRQGMRHCWHLFSICVEDKPGLREGVMRHLLAKGIQTGLHYLPVHLMPSMKERGFTASLSHTERIGRTIMSLPLFPEMTEEQVVRVCSVIGKALLEQDSL